MKQQPALMSNMSAAFCTDNTDDFNASGILLPIETSDDVHDILN